MDMAIAYNMKKQGRKMAEGGSLPCAAHGMDACKMCHGSKMADGGFVEKEQESGYGSMPEESEKRNEHAMSQDDRMLNQHGQDEIGPRGMDEDNESQPDRIIDHPVENQDFPEEEEDMISRIMNRQEQHYSEGGQVANYTGREGDKASAQYDDLVKDDDLEFHYTGENSGDELGNDALEEEMHDIISRIMASRAKRDRNPVPA